MRRRHEDYFAGKTILITGGTSGIGFALAEELIRRSAKVLVLADKPESVSRALPLLEGVGPSVHGYVCDIGIPDQVTKTCARILAAHGAPDILINNAGYAIYRTLEQ